MIVSSKFNLVVGVSGITLFPLLVLPSWEWFFASILINFVLPSMSFSVLSIHPAWETSHYLYVTHPGHLLYHVLWSSFWKRRRSRSRKKTLLFYSSFSFISLRLAMVQLKHSALLGVAFSPSILSSNRQLSCSHSPQDAETVRALGLNLRNCVNIWNS